MRQIRFCQAYFPRLPYHGCLLALAPAPSNKLRAPFSCGAGLGTILPAASFPISSEARAWTQTRASPGPRCISDLTNELAHGRTFAQTASFLCRDLDEVRQKAKELGLVEQHVRVVL